MEERKKADELWQASMALMPWRAIKGAVRSQGAPNRPAVYVEVDRTMAVLATSAGSTAAAATARSTACVELLAYLVIHRHDLVTYDEDLYPRLANILEHDQPPMPVPWYDNPAEHLLVALAVLLLDAADKGDRLPAGDIVFYELSRAPAQPGWPQPLRLIARYARGLVYLQHAFHFAAEEELTAYIAEVDKTPKEALELVAVFFDELAAKAKIDRLQAARESLLALGHLTRAYNRMKLEREEPATDDLEAALGSLDRLGVENELTLWAQAVVHQKRGRYEQAARAMDKLAKSPYLDEPTKKELSSAAADLRKHGKDPGFLHRQRTTLVMVQAVVARLGGVEGILTIVLGKEKAQRWLAPFNAMSSARETLREVADSQKERFKGLSESAAESGKKTLSDWKGRLVEAGAL